MKKSSIVTIRLDPELLERIRQAAEKENRSISNFLENVIKESEKLKQGK